MLLHEPTYTAKLKKGAAIYLFSFLFFSFVAWCSPFSSDDLEYVIHPRAEISEALEFVLSYGNGRLLGNLGALYLCTNTLLRILVKAMVMSTVVVLLPVVLGIYTPANHLLTFILLAGMSGSLFAQTFTWTSGFQNYVPPVFLTLCIIWGIRKIDSGCGRAVSFVLCVSILVLGIASQLYVEISTVLHCLLALSVFLLTARAGKRSQIAGAHWFVGTSLGAAVMFAIPKIFTSPENWNVGYRSTGADSIIGLISSAVINASKLFSFYSENILVCVGLCLCVHHALCRLEKTAAHKYITISKAALKISALYLVINHFVCGGKWYGAMSVLRNMLTAFFLIVPLSIWIVCVWKDEDTRCKVKQLSLIGFAVISLAPLVVVNPISMRCIFLSYVFLVASLLNYVYTKVTFPVLYAQKIKKGICIAGVILALCIGIMFTNIMWLARLRDQYIEYKMENNAEEIVIYPIPYDYVLWDGTNIYRFEYYYSEVGDIKFTAIDYEDWSYMYGIELAE